MNCRSILVRAKRDIWCGCILVQPELGYRRAKQFGKGARHSTALLEDRLCRSGCVANVFVFLATFLLFLLEKLSAITDHVTKYRDIPLLRYCCDDIYFYLFIIWIVHQVQQKNRKKRERETDRQQNAISNQQSARGQIIYNVRKVTDGERIRQAYSRPSLNIIHSLTRTVMLLLLCTKYYSCANMFYFCYLTN